MISPQRRFGWEPGITFNASRWSKTATSVRWQPRSTACRRVWLSGNDSTPHSAPTLTLPWPPASYWATHAAEALVSRDEY